jgi:hypothetical protein
MILAKDNVNKEIITTTSTVKLIENDKNQSVETFFKTLEYNLGCTYMFYIYEDMILDRKIIYSSNWAWQKHLIGEKLINDCPVFKAGSQALAFGKKSIILPWNNIPCNTSIEKEITLLRSEFNISNGIGISHANGIIREGIGLGADIKDYEFYPRVIANNLIYNILKNMRLIALKNNVLTSIH